MRIIFLILMTACAATNAAAQEFAITQSVISAGGGTSASDTTANPQFAVTGTIGQAVAGGVSTNSPFTVRGGFWTAQNRVTTSASAILSGRVVTRSGKGLRNAIVTITDVSGGVMRQTSTSVFGTYLFDGLAAGQTYIVEVRSKRFLFVSQVVTITEDTDAFDFTSE